MLPSADGSLPKLRPEQREVVTEYIPEVMRIMDRLEQQGHHHRDARVALYATEALSYEVSTKSVVKAARTLGKGTVLEGRSRVLSQSSGFYLYCFLLPRLCSFSFPLQIIYSRSQSSVPFRPRSFTAQLARIFKNIDMMVAKHPELKGGAPFIIQGMMFLNAPMPVRSVKKAKECFQSAHRVSQSQKIKAIHHISCLKVHAAVW